MDISLEDLFRNVGRLRNLSLTTNTPVCHSIVLPAASYSPWGDDRPFLNAFDAMRDNTLVDLYRCYELWHLSGQMASVDGDILEVGVWRGGTGCLIASRAQTLAPSKRVFLCDTFSGVVKTGASDPRYKGGEHADTSVDIVKNAAAKLGLRNVDILKGIFPDETAAQIADRKFCFCHIDVDSYESARDTLDWAWQRLSPGGCIVFDDYGFSSCDGIRKLVNERFPKDGCLFVHNINGHAVVVKIK